MSTSSPDTWVGWVDEPDKGRGTFGIISTCLTTVFLCTWTAVHHDVPGDGQPWHITFLKKVALMAGAVLAPEIVTAWSLYQYLRARSLTAWMEQQKIPWSMDHSFCLIMGGFTYDLTDRFPPKDRQRVQTLTISNIQSVVQYGRVDFAATTRKQVKDKSKADGLTKALACFQALYLVIQVIGRVCQRLPVTSLEVSTVGYVPWTLFSYYFWWYKPFNVDVPIQIHDRLGSDTSDTGSTNPVVLIGDLDERLEADNIWELAAPSTRKHWAVLGMFFAVALAFGAFHVALWNAPIFATRVERYIWRATSLGMMIIPALEGTILSDFALGVALSERDVVKPPLLVGLFPKSKPPPWLKNNIERLRLFFGVWGELGLPLLFVVVRLAIIVQIFYGLHSLPEEAYADVNWGKYFPQVSLI